MLKQHGARWLKGSGFTLIEVMIAITIFAVVIASGFACVKIGMGLADNSRHHTRASQIMQSEIERIRSLAWATLNDETATETTLSISNKFKDASYADYVLKRTITGTGDTRKITLVITWKDLSGLSNSKTYVTQYTRGGLYDYIQ